jgi:hypothetical protein
MEVNLLKMLKKEKIDVLIVGAGPSGLAMAHELTRRGISCRIIDKLSKPSDKSKALGVQPRSLELFEGAGLLNDFLKEGLKLKAVNTYSKISERISHVETKYIHSTYPFILIIPQNKTEQILIKNLEKLGVKVERNLELTSYAEENGHVVARIKNDKGKIEETSFKYMIGSDGAHSVCRELMGTNFVGDQYKTNWILADAHIKWPLKFDSMNVFFSENGFLAVFPLGENHVRFIGDYDININREELEKKLNLPFFQKIVTERAGPGIKITKIGWMSAFLVNHRMAKKLCSKNVFLIGDSAHIHSPAGGQGMNTGIQDANSLAWKMELVLMNKAKEELLQSHQERYKVMESVVALSHQMTIMTSIKNPILRFFRNKMIYLLCKFDCFKSNLVNKIGQLKLNYRHSPIVAEDWDNNCNSIKAGDLFPDIELFDKKYKKTRLKKVIKDRKHTLLIFTTNNNAENVERLVKTKYNDVIDLLTIKDKKGSPGSYSTTANIFKQLEIKEIGLYLLRPDGYIAYRNQPIDLNKLVSYLNTIFND